MSRIPELDVGVPTSLSSAASRVQRSVGNLSARTVVGIIVAIIGGPLLLFGAWMLYTLQTVSGMTALPE